MPTKTTNATLTATEKKWLVCIQTYISIDNADKIINYVDQGWTLHELDTYHSLTIRATREIVVETDFIDSYINAISCTHDFNVCWYEEAKAN